jgi:hypothetical protein
MEAGNRHGKQEVGAMSSWNLHSKKKMNFIRTQNQVAGPSQSAVFVISECLSEKQIADIGNLLGITIRRRGDFLCDDEEVIMIEGDTIHVDLEHGSLIEKFLVGAVKCFDIAIVERVRKALRDDAAGNKQCTMTDLDSAVEMLTELIELKKR